MMGVGAVVALPVRANSTRGQWAAVAYLGVVGAAVTFFLWVFALARTTPTKVTNTITAQPADGGDRRNSSW